MLSLYKINFKINSIVSDCIEILTKELLTSIKGSLFKIKPPALSHNIIALNDFSVFNQQLL